MNDRIYNFIEKDDVSLNKIDSEYISDTKIRKIVLENVLNEYNDNMKKIYNSLYETFNNKLIKSEFDYDENTETDYETIKTILEVKINRSEVEWGILSEFDEYVIENIQNENVLKAINQIYIDSFNDENVLLKILNAISQIEYEKVNPYGQTIAIAAISNKNIIVKQKAIETFERWHNEDSIKILENIDVKEKWLQRYLEKVIAYLKEEVKVYA